MSEHPYQSAVQHLLNKGTVPLPAGAKCSNVSFVLKRI